MRTSSRTTSNRSAPSASSARPPVRDGGDKVALPLDVAGPEHTVERLVVDDEDGCLSPAQVNSCSAAPERALDAPYSSSIRGSSSAVAMSVPAFAIASNSRQSSASLVAPNTSPVGLERVRRPTQLLRLRDLERASQRLEQRAGASRRKVSTSSTMKARSPVVTRNCSSASGRTAAHPAGYPPNGVQRLRASASSSR
jgi:hypothetical protein